MAISIQNVNVKTKNLESTLGNLLTFDWASSLVNQQAIAALKLARESLLKAKAYELDTAKSLMY